MDLGLLSKAIGIGIAIAAPVGPVAMLCIQRSLTRGWWPGIFTGLGAATADALLAAISIFGLSAVLATLLDQVNWLQPACGTVLILMGIFIYLEKPATTFQKKREFPLQNIISSWISAFFITILNPATIFAFLAVFVGLKIGTDANHPTQEITIVCGVFIGASIWWLGLTTAAAKFGQKLSVNAISVVNRAGGALVAGCGVLAFIDWALI